MNVKMDDGNQLVDGVDIASHVAKIKHQGFTIVENFLSPKEVATIRKEFNSKVPMTEMRAIGVDTGKTLRAHNLLAKTRVVDYLFVDQRLRGLVEGVIGRHTQINVTTLFNVLPGEQKMLLHSDDGLWPIPRPHPAFLCNALIALDDSDIENGATHLVPFSHLWSKPIDQDEKSAIQVPLASGSMLVWDGALWHGGGANVSENRERLGLFMSHQVSYLRPQEIQLIAVPRKVVRKMPRLLQQQLGYHRFGLGVDGRDPIDVLNDGIVVNPSAKIDWRPE